MERINLILYITGVKSILLSSHAAKDCRLGQARTSMAGRVWAEHRNVSFPQVSLLDSTPWSNGDAQDRWGASPKVEGVCCACRHTGRWASRIEWRLAHSIQDLNWLEADEVPWWSWFCGMGNVTILFPYCSILLIVHSFRLLTWRGRGNACFINTAYFLVHSVSTFSLVDLSSNTLIS